MTSDGNKTLQAKQSWVKIEEQKVSPAQDFSLCYPIRRTTQRMNT
jgi:hypothetical protein